MGFGLGFPLDGMTFLLQDRMPALFDIYNTIGFFLQPRYFHGFLPLSRLNTYCYEKIPRLIRLSVSLGMRSEKIL